MIQQQPSASSQNAAPVSTRDRSPASKPLPNEGDSAVIFIDGECVMCNGFANALMQIDSDHRVLISTLQGETAQQYLPPLPSAREAWSIVYWDKQGFYTQSEAIIKLSHRLGGWLSALGTLIQIIPAPVRNVVYRFIGRYRYRLFGKRSTCRIPTEEEKARFLP